MPRDILSRDPLHAYALPARVTGTDRPIPLVATRIAVGIDGLLATVTTERVFRNAEDRSIEATLTFPAPVHATLLALRAVIGGRTVVGTAMRRGQARATYEAAVDDGKTAVLHEEVLRGVHMISVAHVPPGTDVTVSGTWSMPLAPSGSLAVLRIPVTVGDIYGRSPLSDSDDLAQGAPLQEAEITLDFRGGAARLAGWGPIRDGVARVRLDAPLDFTFEGLAPAVLHGVGADGRTVTLAIFPAPAGDGRVEAAIVSDRSGSMNEAASGRGSGGSSKLAVVHAALAAEAGYLRADDRLSLWQFDDDAEEIAATSFGLAVAAMTGTKGGTRIGRSLARVIAASGCRDILLVTDGKSHDIDVQALARSGRRVSVVLVGEDSLEAHVGQLAALTGGQLFVAAGSDAAGALRAAFAALRLPKAPAPPLEGAPERVEAIIAGMCVHARWGVAAAGDAVSSRAVAAVAAALAIPRMAAEAAAALAVAEGIVCHLTSLVLVDEEGAVQEGIPAQRKVPTMAPRTAFAAPMAAAPAPAPRAASRPMLMRVRMPPAGGAAVGSPASPPPPAPADPFGAIGLRDCRGRIDWARDPETLRRGDLAGLAPDVADAVRAAAATPALAALAARLGLDPVVLALALLARAEQTDRSAARFARAVLAAADTAELEKVGRAVGLPGG